MICHLVLSHRHPEQVGRLTSALLTGAPDTLVVVHHDRAASRLDREALDDRVVLLPWSSPLTWGDWSLVQVVLDAGRWIRERADPDWLVLLSGQDYPIRPLAEIEAGLAGSGCDAFVFARRLAPDAPERRVRRYPDGPCWKGSAWVSLGRAAMDRVLAAERSAQAGRFRDALHPDEAFFHTVLFEDPALRIADDDRRYMRWAGRAARPEVLTIADLPAIERSGRDFARKLDLDVDPALFDALDDRVRAGATGYPRLP